jgi:preprotein translocase subunit SecD
MTALARTIALLSLSCGACAVLAQPSPPVAKFEIRRAESKPGEGLTEVIVAGSGDKIYLHKKADIVASDVADARVTKDGKPVVEIAFTEAGHKKINRLTEQHQGKPLAIMVDGKVIAAPVVRSTIESGKAMVTGNFTREEAERIASGIKPK